MELLMAGIIIGMIIGLFLGDVAMTYLICKQFKIKYDLDTSWQKIFDSLQVKERTHDGETKNLR